MGRGQRALDHLHQSRRPHEGPLRLHANRSAQSTEAPRHPRHRRVQGPLVPHQPVGLRVHRRRLEREPVRVARQDGRHHRHRRHSGPVRPPPGRSGPAAVRVPAHAVVDRRAGQPPDRSGVGVGARARLAPLPDGELQHAGVGRHGRRGSGQRRLDRHHPQAAGDVAAGPGRAQSTSATSCRPWSWPTFRRWSRSGPGSTKIVQDEGTAESLKPYYRQFCKRPCFHDEYLDTFNRPERDAGGHAAARASTRSPRVASSPTGSSTNSTA